MLTFKEFREQNEARNKRWMDGKPIPALFAACELGGEVGEALNVVKKLARSEYGIRGGSEATIEMLAEELGDVVICANLLAQRFGINLGLAVAEKFNKTSEKRGFPERLST